MRRIGHSGLGGLPARAGRPTGAQPTARRPRLFNSCNGTARRQLRAGSRVGNAVGGAELAGGAVQPLCDADVDGGSACTIIPDSGASTIHAVPGTDGCGLLATGSGDRWNSSD